MSDYILKFWPKQETEEIKTAKLVEELSKSEIIADETEPVSYTHLTLPTKA